MANNLMTDSNAVMKLLECPVCMEIIHIPIYQCFHGHLLCKSCIKGVKTCPICRDEMPSKPIRNLALEKMTENCEFNCRNNGCNVKLKQADFKNHSYDCLYETRDFCKSLALYQNVAHTCDKQIRKSDIADHMKTYHNLKGVDGNKAEVIQTLESYNQSLMWIPVYFKVYDTVFFITGGYSNREGNAKWNCIVAGSSKAAKAFHVQMSLYNVSPKIRLTWEGPILGIDRTPNETQVASFVVTKQNLEAFCQNGTKKPEWKIQVIIKKLRTEISSPSGPVVPAPEAYPSLGSLSVAINDIEQTPPGSLIDNDNLAPGVAFHNGVTCDGCHIRNIPGSRYKCLQCSDYDLCDQCITRQIHDHHIFLRIAKETQRSKAYEFFVKAIRKWKWSTIVNTTKNLVFKLY